MRDVLLWIQAGGPGKTDCAASVSVSFLKILCNNEIMQCIGLETKRGSRVDDGLSVKVFKNHHEISKGCTENISSVVEVSSCYNPKTFGKKFGFFRT